MTFDEKLDRLGDIVRALASSVVAHDSQNDAHDRQIDGLIRVAEAQRLRIDELNKSLEETGRAIAATERQWQAYINTLPKQ